jgi:hypothetical protein
MDELCVKHRDIGSGAVIRVRLLGRFGPAVFPQLSAEWPLSGARQLQFPDAMDLAKGRV